MEARNDATLHDERRSAAAALLDCPSDDQENRAPRQQRSRASRVSDSSARSKLTLLRFPKRQETALTDGYNGDGHETKEFNNAATESPTVDEAGQARRASRRAPNRGGRSEARMSPVAPLRFDRDVNAACLKLLGVKRSRARQLPLRARQYVYEPAVKAKNREDHATSGGAGVDTTEVTVTRAASVQTAGAVDDKVVQTSLASSAPSPSSSRLLDTPPSDSVGRDQAASDEHREKTEKQEDRAIGVQCQLHEPNQPSLGASVVPRGITDRFPVWIDLKASASEGNAIEPPKKYLQVVTFTWKLLDTGSGRVVVPRPAVEIVRTGDEDTVEPEDDSVRLSEVDIPATQDEIHEQDATPTTSAAHRERYRLHYASRMAKTDTETSAEGVQGLVEVKNDMDRMKQRLLELEAFADSIDYEFKLSYQILGGDEDQDQDNDKMKAQQVLGRVDQVLQNTKPDSTEHSDESKAAPSMSILTQKATNDAASARMLLEQIERLTLARNDDQQLE